MSKGTIGTFAGAAIGFVVSGFNPVGAQVGAMIGGAIGSSFDVIPGRKVGEMSSPRAQEGEPIPWVCGSASVRGRLMSVGEPDIRKTKESGKGGPKVENETAYLSYSILIAESSELRDSTISGILMVRQNNDIVYDVRATPAISAADSAKWKSNKIFYFGGEAQGVDSTEQMIHGAGNVPAYRGLCRMVVTDEDVTQHGGSIPTYEFVTSQCGTGDAGGGSGGFPTFLLVTGSEKTTGGPVYAAALSAPTPSFTGIDISTGGDVAGGVPACYNGTWCVVGNDLINYSTDDRATWQDGTINSVSPPRQLMGGHAGWVANENEYGSGRGHVCPTLLPTEFTATTFSGTYSNGVDAASSINAAKRAFYFDGYYYRNNQRNLFRCDTPGGTYLAAWDTFKNTAAGIDNNGPYVIIEFTDLCKFGVDFYAAIKYGFTSTRTMVVRSVNGIEDWASLDVFVDIAGAGAHQPMQICPCGDYLVALASGGGVWTSANGWASWVDNGLTTSGFSGARKIAYADGRIYVIDDADKCVVSSDGGLTWSAPITMPVTAAVGIVAGTHVVDAAWLPIPDAPDYYIDPITSEIDGPTTAVTDCALITLSEIIDKLDARAGIPIANSVTTELDGITVPGYAIDTFATVAEAKEPLRRVYFFDSPEYDDAIRYRLRGGATDFTVLPDDLIIGEDATEKGVRGQTVEFPKRLHVQYVDPATGFKPMKQTAERISPDIRVKGEEVASANITLDADTAKQAADIGLKTAWTAREDSREIALPMDYLKAIPSDCYSLDGRRYRITDLRIEAGAIYIQSEYDRISAYSSNAVGEVGPSPTSGSDLRGPTIGALMNIPALRDADNLIGIYVAGCGVLPGWAGYAIQLSRDGGLAWRTEVDSVTSASSIGTLTASLPVATSPDVTNTLSVQMQSGSLDSITGPQMDAGGNAAAILYPDGTAEIINFQDTVETSPGVYDLTTLLRGRLETTVATHDVGAQFVMLDTSLQFIRLRESDLGQTLTFRLVSLGTPEAMNATKEITMTTFESPRDNVIDGGSPTTGTVSGGTVPIDPVNPGFESDLTSWEEGAAYPVVSSAWAVITDTPNAHGGDKFLRWTGDSTPLTGGVLRGMTYFNTTHVDSSGQDLLIVNVWARCKRAAAGGVGLTRARVGFVKYDAAGNELSNTIAGAVALYGGSLDSGWTQISTFTAKTDDTAYFRVFLEAQGPAGSVVEFDDLTWNGAAP